MNMVEIVKEKGMLHLNGMTSDYITTLLSDKHCKDVFIPQCKNGETWGARDLLKLDAWVLRRTYSPLTTIGYEIKVSRQDFEQDQKWTSYIDLCHEFFFVCPAGLIRSTDLPSNIGLIWVSQTGKLHTKHKAEYHQPDNNKQVRLLIYALMARSKIVNENEPAVTDKLNDIRFYIERAKEKGELANFVKGHIKEVAQSLQTKEIALTHREDYVKRFEERLAKLGITWDSEHSQWQDNNRVDNEISLLKAHLDLWTIREIKDVGNRMIKVADTLEQLHNSKENL